MRSCLFSIVACAVLFCIAGLAYGDEIGDRLNRARVRYKENMEKETQALMKAYDDAIKSYTQKGDLENALRVKEEKEEFMNPAGAGTAAKGADEEFKMEVVATTSKDNLAGTDQLSVFLLLNGKEEYKCELDNPLKDDFKLGAVDVFKDLTFRCPASPNASPTGEAA